MKLYSMPGACSTADHIALHWTGQPFQVQVLDKAALKSPEYLKINPTGAVPALEDGDLVLTQNAAILGYIADRHPQAGLAGDGSPARRAEANRWLAFVNSDLHPAFKPLFNPGRYIADEAQHGAIKASARQRVRELLESADRRLATHEWLAGFRSYADPYFYVTLRWAHGLGIDMGGLDHIAAFKSRMEADPGVQAALRTEGLDRVA